VQKRKFKKAIIRINEERGIKVVELALGNQGIGIRRRHDTTIAIEIDSLREGPALLGSKSCLVFSEKQL
jgi:hypothetical protein